MNTKIIQLLLVLLLNFSLVAQQIVSGEYFFDTAPNQGAGIPISFAANTTVNHSMSIPTSGLNTGIHQLYVRVKNDANVWSHYQKRMIYVIEPLVVVSTEIVAAEWFIDTDPGVGNGTNLTVTAGNTVSGTVSIPNAMAPGIHHVYIRVKNNLGIWSHQRKSMFYILEPLADNSTTLVKAEYFFDTDPGVGNGTQINVTPSTSINQNLAIDLNGLSAGIHHLFVRTKNNRGIWGHYQKRMIYVTNETPSENKTIVAAEYFINTDPGLNMGTSIPIVAGTNLLEDFVLNTTSIPLGEHYLFIRVKEDNGRWSHYASHKFLICNDVLTTPLISGNATVCQNAELNLEGGTIPNATNYFWIGPNNFMQTGTSLNIPTVDQNTSGLYTFFATREGGAACDTAYAEVSVVVNPIYTTQNPQTICEGETYTFNNHVYSTSGNYYDTLVAQNSCDSIIETVLTVVPSFSSVTDVSICEGESYTAHGNTYSSSGTYTSTFQSINGCDSTFVTNLTVNPVSSTSNPQVICQGGSYTINGNTYTVAGTYTDVLQSPEGCDSVVTTLLTVVDVFEVTNTASICDGESVTVGTNTYFSSGTYTDILQSIAGCDSIVTTELTVNPTFTVNNPQTICEGETYSINGNLYSAAGTYTDVFITASGCDSTVYTQLSVTTIFLNTNVMVNEPTLTAVETNASYQWIDCSDNSWISGATNQSFTATTIGSYAVILSSLECDVQDTSACYQINSIGLENIDGTVLVKAYPNPASETITIETSALSSKMIRIYDGVGKVVFESAMNDSKIHISCSTWSAGMYTIELTTNEHSYKNKVIKK